MNLEKMIVVNEFIDYTKGICERVDEGYAKEIFVELKSRFNIECDVDVVRTVVDAFGYKAIDWIPVEFLQDINIVKLLAKQTGAETYIEKEGKISIFKSPENGKPLFVVYDGSVVCVKASAAEVLSVIKKPANFANLQTKLFRLDENGNSVSNDLVKVILHKLRKGAEVLPHGVVEKDYKDTVVETIDICTKKTQEAEEELSNQDYLYHIGKGYLDVFKNYLKNGVQDKKYIEAPTLPLNESVVEAKVWPSVEDYLDYEIRSYIDIGQSFVQEGMTPCQVAIAEVYSTAEDIAKEIESFLEGHFANCTLTQEKIEELKRQMFMVYKDIEKKTKTIENYYGSKNEILDIISDAEDNLIR